MRPQVTNAASAPGLSWNQACGLMGTNKTQTAMGHSLPREGHWSSASGAGHTAVTGAKPQPTGRETQLQQSQPLFLAGNRHWQYLVFHTIPLR